MCKKIKMFPLKLNKFGTIYLINNRNRNYLILLPKGMSCVTANMDVWKNTEAN